MNHTFVFDIENFDNAVSAFVQNYQSVSAHLQNVKSAHHYT